MLTSNAVRPMKFCGISEKIHALTRGLTKTMNVLVVILNLVQNQGCEE